MKRLLLLGLLTPFLIYCSLSFYLRSFVVHHAPIVREFEDVNFRPVLAAYRKRNTRFEVVNKFRSGKSPTFLLVTTKSIKIPFWKQQLRHILEDQCALPCSVTDDRNKSSEVDAIVFYLREMKDGKAMQKFVPKRDPKQPWVMLSFEAAILANSIYKTNYNKFNGIFNRTMMHRTDADVYTPHGFVVSHADAQLLPSSWVHPPPSVPVSAPGNDSRRLVVSFISNCGPKSGRNRYIQIMQKISNEIDVYGKCGTKKCGNRRYVQHGYRTDLDKCFIMAGQHYLFYLAFENSFCKDYITEKVYNLLYHQVVPVVMGGSVYRNILPPNSYIDATHYSPVELVKYLISLKSNPEEYQKFFAWKKFYRTSTIGGVRSMCHLCVRLYDPEFYEYSVYNDFYYWFKTRGNCSWTYKPGIGVARSPS